MSKVRQHPLLVFLVQMTQSILLREIAYLKAENTILRSRCPKQIQTTPAERSLLVRLGMPLDNAIQEMLSLVPLQDVPSVDVRGESKPSADFPPGGVF